jgi:nitric oxide reductase NorE protein
VERQEVHAVDKIGRHVPGEPGLWVLLFGDLTVFAVLFGLYLHARGRQPDVVAASQHTLNQNFGAVNTLVLLSSSLLLVYATNCARHQNRQRASSLLLCTIGLGLGFVVIKFLEYHEQISQGHTPTTNTFYMYYFVLTGIHLIHLVVGLLVLTALRASLSRSKTPPPSTIFAEGAACFWHMVDLLWVIIFPLLFLVG